MLSSHNLRVVGKIIRMATCRPPVEPYGVPSEADKPCSEDDLRFIGVKLADHGISTSVISRNLQVSLDTSEATTCPATHCDEICQLLLIWKRNTPATRKVLLDFLHKLNNPSLLGEVEKYFRIEPQSGHDPNVTGSHRTCREIIETPVNPQTRERFEDLRYQFSCIVGDFQDALDDTPTTKLVNKLHTFLSEKIASFGPPAHYHSDLEEIKRLRSQTTVTEIFAYLNETRAWDFLNIHLLELVMKEFGKDFTYLQRRLEQHKRDIDRFKQETLFEDFLDIWYEPNQLFKQLGLIRLKSKFKIPWNRFTLEDFAKHQGYVCSQFLLQEHVLRFDKATKGSVVAVWYGPKALEEYMVKISKERKPDLAQGGKVVELAVGNSLIFVDSEERGEKKAEQRVKIAEAQDLRGVEVCAEITLIVNNRSQHFHWNGYGLTLHFPDGCLPADVENCLITIKASLAGQYEFPQGSYLVSAVYWLRCEPRCRFTKAIAVEIEHCAPRENTDKLNVVRSHCTQEQLPYTFQKLRWGKFTEQNSYAYIDLNSFSGLCITQDESEEREYCAGLYYLEKTRLNPDIHFVVHWDNEAHLTHVRTHYNSEGAVKGSHYTFSFESDAITLDIPKEGIAVSDVWRIEPLTPLIVTKKTVDSFKPRHHIPSCELGTILARQSIGDANTIPVLTYKIKICGARHPFDFLTAKFAVPLHLNQQEHRVTLDSQVKLNETPSINLLFKELYGIADMWEEIGIFLDIDDGELAVVKSNQQTNCRACLREMLRLWLKRVLPPPTWSAVIEAIDSLGNEALAVELRKKYTSCRSMP